MPHKDPAKRREYHREWRKQNPLKWKQYYETSLANQVKEVTEERKQYMKKYLAKWRIENKAKIISYRRNKSKTPTRLSELEGKLHIAMKFLEGSWKESGVARASGIAMDADETLNRIRSFK